MHAEKASRVVGGRGSKIKEKVEENKVRIKRGRVQACKIVYALKGHYLWSHYPGCFIENGL